MHTQYRVPLVTDALNVIVIPVDDRVPSSGKPAPESVIWQLIGAELRVLDQLTAQEVVAPVHEIDPATFVDPLPITGDKPQTPFVGVVPEETSIPPFVTAKTFVPDALETVKR